MDKRALFFPCLVAAIAVAIFGCGGQGTSGFSTTTSTAGSLGLNGQPINGPIGPNKAGATGQATEGNEILFALAAEDGTNISALNPTSKGTSPIAKLPIGQTIFTQSPTTALVAFSALKDGQQGLYVNTSASIDRATLLGAANFASFGSVQFTPDSKRLVFTGTQAGQQPAVFVCGVDGKGFRRLDDGDDASISPDGKRVVYSKMVGGAAKLFVRPLDGSGMKQLTSGSGHDLLPQFTKDGKRILYTSIVGNSVAVESVPASGGKITRLLDGAYGATMSPDGKQIAYSRFGKSPDETGIFIAEATGKNPVRLADSPSVIGPLYWTTPSAAPGRTANQPGALSASMSDRAKVLLKLPEVKPLPAAKTEPKAEEPKKGESKPAPDRSGG